ncbi:MAG: nuclease-related domain-containing protein [Gammaproteobacteria bacterium]|jgi:hypothetical protein
MDSVSLLHYPGVLYWTLPVGLGLIAVGATVLWRERSGRQRRMEKALKAMSHDMLSDFVIPDGMDGFIHVDYLLLTATGLLVVDAKDIDGRIFGAEKMDEWAVFTGRQRFGFRNPLGPLRDRVAAVQALARDIPVHGLLVFGEGADFPKGVPREAVLVDELARRRRPASERYPEAFDQAWRHLRQNIVQHGAH